MARIEPLDPVQADEEAKAELDAVRKHWGAAWNITDTLARNPAVLRGFFALWQAIEESGLGPLDREAICLEMAVQNGCHYCVPAHMLTARQQGLETDRLDRIAVGETLTDGSREALMQRLVRGLLASKGKLTDNEFREFRDLGLGPEHMMAVVAEIAHCVLTNYFNRLCGTELDSFLVPFGAYAPRGPGQPGAGPVA